MSYSYYPQQQYYQQQQQQQMPYYYNSSPIPTQSDNSSQHNPVASAWLNQGTNAYNYNNAQQFYPTTEYYPQNQPTQSYKTQKTETLTSDKTYKSATKSRHESRTHSRTSDIINEALQDDLNQLTPQLEAAYEEATGKRRSPVIKRQVITMPGQQGRVQQVVRRLPTPTPDVIERIFIVKPQRDTINLIIERPSTPPVQYKDKTIYGKSRRPIINPKIVNVQSSQFGYPQLESGYYGGGYPQIQHQEQGGMPPVGYLLAPIKHNEVVNPMMSIMPNDQMMMMPMQQQQTLTQNNSHLSHAPTFSTNVLQPYNPPMFADQFGGVGQQQNFQGYQYPVNFPQGQQMF